MASAKDKAIGIPASIWRDGNEITTVPLLRLERTDEADPDELQLRLANEEAFVSLDRLRTAIAELVRIGPRGA